MSSKTTRTLVTAIAVLILAGSANAAVEVTPDHIVSGSATGTLVAIDVPFVGSVNGTPGVFGGPTWTTGGSIVASPADQGFTTVNDGIREDDGSSQWEPDGTPIAEAKAYRTFGNGPIPSVTWTFNLAASGMDIPDDSIINAIYATWSRRNVDGITYQYTEGAASDSIVRQTNGTLPVADLVLSWTDDETTTHNANFERLFEGPITVTGGDGFELWGTDNIRNAAHIDAVVIDVTLNLAPDLPGDANGSGYVDDNDLAVLLGNWEADPGTITTWALGDFTADTDVDDDDLAVLLGNWTGPPPGGAAVPEPATLALLGLGGLSVLRRRRK